MAGLYIPSGWWHGVRVVEGPAISVAGKLQLQRLGLFSAVPIYMFLNSAPVAVCAGRSYTLCEGLSYIPNFLMLKAVELGLTEPSSFCINPDYIDQI